MGDISMRGKGKALKMKKGGALPSNKGASKAGMQSKQGRNFLLPKEEKPGRPKRPKAEPRPRPMPMPRPDRRPSPRPMPMPKPMPDRSPRIKEKIKELMEELKPRRRQTGLPVKRKDGGEMITGKFGKATSEFLTQAMTKGGLGAMGVSAEKLKKAFEKAKKMKPTGRLNMDDLKKALGMLGAAKKAVPKIKGRLGGPKTSPIKRRVSDALKRQSKIKDPKNKNKKLI